MTFKSVPGLYLCGVFANPGQFVFGLLTLFNQLEVLSLQIVEDGEELTGILEVQLDVLAQFG